MNKNVVDKILKEIFESDYSDCILIPVTFTYSRVPTVHLYKRISFYYSSYEVHIYRKRSPSHHSQRTLNTVTEILNTTHKEQLDRLMEDLIRIHTL